MPWNEPGDPSKNKDPWTGRPKQTPPDLEAFLRDLCKKVVALFKLKILNKKSAIISKSLLPELNPKALGLVSVLCLFAWLASGFFKVNSTQQAIITRFGGYKATLDPGYHWILRPIEQYAIINPGKVDKFSTTVNLLTQDENKVTVDVDIDYSIVNARNYLFASAHPLVSLQEITHHAVNRVLSQYTLTQLLTTSHFSLQERLQNQLNSLMTKDTTGLAIRSIELQAIQVPDQLKASFADVATAQKDREQLENQAKAYAIQVEPNAKAEARRFILEAKAYQAEVILKAKAETTRFLALLPAYEASPTLTQKRLYLEALQTMMVHNKLIIANANHTNFSLTLDKSAAIQAVNTSKLPVEPTISSSKNTIAEDSNSKISNHTIPSSYDIAGGYE